ncbi:TonB-dependent receptor [Bacteroides stercorirosoris]|uniref:TonB-dependent receptor n=1 Tax=Bacteroides stercorirosoris TaxID=871324 RepID=UPI0023F26F66|nr:TonB-dependent receptor [Bacteroides stercorirosoris]
MKKQIYLIVSFLLLTGTYVSAQTLKGHIYDAGTNESLAGATVTYTLHGKQGVVSDINGAYEISLPEGGVDLIFSYVGYDDMLVPIVISRRENMTKDIYMKESTNLLQDVVVSAGRFEQKLSDVTVSMNVLKASDIARQAPTDITSTLQTLPGVDIVDKQPSIRGGGGWTYSVGARSLVLVDGMSTLSPKTGEINWNTVPLENIEQVEVIKGASSVLYGSSALNGIINIRTARPGLTPQSRFSTYVGIYDDPKNESYAYSDNTFWKNDKYPVEPILRNSLYNGIRKPIYEGFDFSHSRRIGNFDVSGGLNLFTDEGYREQSYNKRFRAGGNLTYHQPDMGTKFMNYGFNIDFLSNKYGDFFIWRSPAEPYKPSPFTNMGREANNIHIDPFFNYVNPDNGTSHKVKGRFYYSSDNLAEPTQGASITDILGNMGTDAQQIQNIVNGDLSILDPLYQGILQGNVNDIVNGAFTALEKVFPNATTADYCDLISWVMNNGLPSDIGAALEGKIPSDLVPWLSGVMNPTKNNARTKQDKCYNYYLDYQFNKKWDGGAQITAGTTFEHIRYNSAVMGETHNSDNVALFFQYDQRFWNRLSVSAGVRAEYYRVNEHYREAESKIFGAKVPFRPVFRAGLNYQLADYSFLRASFGQGYRNPSITEKFLRKDIGGVGVYPNYNIQPEKGFNAEIGIKQGYKIGNLQGFLDVAGFYTQYKNMVEFQFGLFNNANNQMINSIPSALLMLVMGQGFGIGAQFHNVSKAEIYGAEISTTGAYNFNKNTKLVYNLGYVYTEPRDADYKKRNAIEDAYTDPLQMKEKSNNSKYLKYRPKHSFKASMDFQWKRFNLGGNVNWKSKILAVDYIMLDERPKELGEFDLMNTIRTILFGYGNGETLASYWKKHNTDYCTVDLRMGVKATKEVAFQFMVNNLFNKEYSYRPMALGAPRTFVVKMDVTF